MPLLTKYEQSYGGKTLSGAAIFPSQVARSLYLRCRYCLIYFYITEVEKSQSAEIGSAESDAPLLSNDISNWI